MRNTKLVYGTCIPTQNPALVPEQRESMSLKGCTSPHEKPSCVHLNEGIRGKYSESANSDHESGLNAEDKLLRLNQSTYISKPRVDVFDSNIQGFLHTSLSESASPTPKSDVLKPPSVQNSVDDDTIEKVDVSTTQTVAASHTWSVETLGLNLPASQVKQPTDFEEQESQALRSPISHHPSNTSPQISETQTCNPYLTHSRNMSEIGGNETSMTEINTSEAAQEAFSRLVPLLQVSNSNNCGAFLVEVLKECADHVDLGEFYTMLYGDDCPKVNHTLDDQGSQTHHHSSESRLKAIKLQLLVIGTFRYPNTFSGGSFFSTINFHEVSRNFLAMKIIFGCIKKVDNEAETLTRLAVYQVYYILCKRLISKYPNISNSFCFEQTLILGRSKLGVIIKLIHPDLVCKRLGKRGKSQAQYIGLTWNRNMVDDETLDLLSLDIPEIGDYFHKIKQTVEASKRRRISNIPVIKQPHPFQRPKSPIRLPFSTKPLYSFVNLVDKFPDLECSPQVWNVTPNSIPKHSEWANNVMRRSLQVLKTHGVNLDSLVSNISTDLDSWDDPFSLSRTIIHSIKVLSDASSREEIFLHLYLVVSLLIIPHILASDQEVSDVSKSKLRSSINNCVKRLEFDVAFFTSVDVTSLHAFTKVLRKMVHISEMTSSKVQIHLSSRVLMEMTLDIRFATSTMAHFSDLSVLEDSFITGFMNALNAYGYDSADYTVEAIQSVGKCFKEVVVKVMRGMLSISACINAKEIGIDVPYQVFRLSVKHFHEVALSNPAFLRLPIPIINFMILHYTQCMQNVSFDAFTRRDHELSKETFKSWWIYSSMFQEYLSVLSEIVSLSQMLT